MKKKIIIVGGGISGLTAAAYLSKSGNDVTILEKADSLGGLVGSFSRNGFIFDSGIRAIENSGVVFPMLRELGIDMPFIKNNVSIGIQDQMIRLSPTDGLSEYKTLLENIFPHETHAINQIIDFIQQISNYMDVLYGIDNPLFLDPKKDREYFMKTIIPWMFKYMLTINKIQKLNTPVNRYLLKITKNQSLIDMITQHFFADTPTFFALSYFRLYTDYYYPEGSTGRLIEKLEDYIHKNCGTIKKNSEVTRVDLQNKTICCSNNCEYKYDKLLWAADLKSLYNIIDINDSTNINVSAYKVQKERILNSKGNSSIFTLYILSELNPDYFINKCSEHTFFTPDKTGLSTISLSVSDLLSNASKLTDSDRKELLFKWIKEYAEKTTFEISIPVLRDKTLAPLGKSGLIISTVFDYFLTEYLHQNGLYNDFKEFLSISIINVLTKTIFPDLKNNVIEYFFSTPVTIQKRLNNTHGAITGWSFTDKSPVENRMIKIAKSVDTPFKDIYQSGHWVFSPSGLPTSIITAKLAVDKILKD